ncbi:MAG: hypothetical protein ACPGYX_06300 [Oceanobacter sp.]
MRTLTVSEFMTEYRPIANPRNTPIPENSPTAYQGYFYSKDGIDFAHVNAWYQENPDAVWTLVQNKQGEIQLSSGFTIVNRIGYLICSEPADAFVEVV